MKIDLRKYAINRPIIQGWWRRDKDKGEELCKMIGFYAIGSHCPCIVVCFYIAEDIGYTDELCNTISKLAKFYGYTDVLGQLEGSPYLTSPLVDDIVK